MLRSYSSQSTNKRKSDELNDQINFISTTNDINIVSPSPPQTTINFRRTLTIEDIIGKKISPQNKQRYCSTVNMMKQFKSVYQEGLIFSISY